MVAPSFDPTRRRADALRCSLSRHAWPRGLDAYAPRHGIDVSTDADSMLMGIFLIEQEMPPPESQGAMWCAWRWKLDNPCYMLLHLLPVQGRR